jgi:hypothetical protein
MSQLTIYLDKESMKCVKAAAKTNRTSVSRWARARLCEALRHTWPADYFSLFGALRGSDFDRPTQGTLADDAARRGL